MTDSNDETKLTRTKRKWAAVGKFLLGGTARGEHERLPPGQHLVQDWPVLDLGMTPQVSQQTFRLDITGAVGHPASWDFGQFTAQPQTSFVTDIHCVTTWSRYDNRWDGVSTRDLLDIVMPRPEARFVELHASDGYTTNLTIEDFAAADAILAHSWEGKPLTREHGGPVRLVVPHLYFWKSAKWLSRIHFLDRNRPGFWERNGYNDRGDPWAEERYS